MGYKVTQKIAKTPEEKPRFIIDYEDHKIECPSCGMAIKLSDLEQTCITQQIVSMKCSNCGHEKP